MKVHNNPVINGALILGAVLFGSCTHFQSSDQTKTISIDPKSKQTEQALSCFSRPLQKLRKPESESVFKKAKITLLKNKQGVMSLVWDQGALDKQANLKHSLTQFSKGLRGGSLKKVSLEGQSMAKIHRQLIDLGFRHTLSPLMVGVKNGKQAPMYWLRDGSQASKIKDKKELLPFHIYVHDDGSLVRLKPAGVPDPKRKNPRPQPHGSKSVLMNLDKVCVDATCELDTSFENEGFKVAENGLPIPKAPTLNYGLRRLPKLFSKDGIADLNAAENAWKDAVMDMAHINLQADFSHCHD